MKIKPDRFLIHFFSRKYILEIFIILFCFLFYANTLKNEYALDDAIVITRNSFTKKGISGIPEILKYDTFTGFFGEEKKLVSGGRYRPLSVITFAIEYEFFGLNPFISHLINILLYALTSLLLFRIFVLLFVNKSPPGIFSIPFITALLFVIHPVHTEVVANIKGRDELLSLLGSLASLYFSLKYLEYKKLLYLLWSFLFFSAGIFSKENTICFLAIIPLTIYFFYKEKLKTFLMVMLPAMVSSLIFIIIRYKIIGFTNEPPSELMNNPFLHASTIQKYATIIYTLGLYIRLLFFPHPLTYDYYPYHIRLVDFSNGFVWLSVLVYAIILILAITGFKTKRVYSFYILFYLVTLSIVSNVIFPIGTFMNERFLYMPSIGFCMMIGSFVSHNSLKKIPSFAKVSFLILLLSASFYKTYTRNAVWKDDYTLFTHDVKISTNSAKSNTSAGGVMIEKANTLKNNNEANLLRNKAIVYLQKAIKIHPTYFDAVLLMGNAWADLSNIDSAIYYYRYALRLSPNKEFVFDNMDIVLNRTPDTEKRIAHYEQLFTLYPQRFSINYNLGYLYGRYRNNFEKAIFHLEKAIKIKPSDFAAHKDLGVAYALNSEFEKSKEQFVEALKINPDDLDTRKNLYLTFLNLGNKKKAEEILVQIKTLENKIAKDSQ